MRPLEKTAIWVSIVAILCCSTLVFATADGSVSDVVKRSSDAVVLIVISNSAGQDTALGSGFLISADGEIVTNYHVIKDAHSAIVKLSNGAFFPVEGILATDVDKDLAVIKVNGRNLPSLTLGNMDNVHVGDHIVAIGSPLGLEGTVSDGIVSALRDAGGRKWIQTTAPVSHGNSGGPLLDLNDQVVGVVTWGVNLELGQNLNFAAPCSEVQALLAHAHQQPRPLDSTEKSSANVATTKDGVLTSGTGLWTSITTGKDYKITQDGDYLYLEWTNVPAQIQTAGGFMRDELKKTPDGKWRGKANAYLPCQYRSKMNGQFVTNWCRLDDDMEIDILSEKRIEGIAPGWEKFDCKKCEPKEVIRRSFTIIPKQ